jgi:hypothetical protein
VIPLQEVLQILLDDVIVHVGVHILALHTPIEEALDDRAEHRQIRITAHDVCSPVQAALETQQVHDVPEHRLL